MRWLEEELKELKEKGLYRQLYYSREKPGKFVNLNGKRLLNLSSNDYLGLAKEFSFECFYRWGCGSGASRLVSGSYAVHRRLEEELARLKKAESALLFSTGYMANLAVISTLAKEGDLILSDQLNHASIIDGCRLSKATRLVYRHRDLNHLEDLLKRNRKRFKRAFIVTDSVFSMDGTLAPLKELFELKNLYDVVLIVDDAHGTGVVGNSALDLFNLTPDETTVIVGTLGKALGTFGAFVAGSKTLREYLINKARPFIYTTALPPAVACQTLKNLKKMPLRMKKLQRLIKFFSKLTGIERRTAIFPILCENEKEALQLAAYLKEAGYWVPAIRPPTVRQSRLRVSLITLLTEDELTRFWIVLRGFLG